MESLGINIYQIIFQLVNFTILLVILKKFLYKPVMDYVNNQKQREQDYHRITQEIDNQKEMLEKLSTEQRAELKKVYDDTLEKAKKEAHQIVIEAKESAKQEGKRILNEYTQEAEQNSAFIKDSAKKEIYEYAVKISQAVITSSLTDEQKKKLMDLAMENLNNA